MPTDQPTEIVPSMDWPKQVQTTAGVPLFRRRPPPPPPPPQKKKRLSLWFPFEAAQKGYFQQTNTRCLPAFQNSSENNSDAQWPREKRASFLVGWFSREPFQTNMKKGRNWDKAKAQVPPCSQVAAPRGGQFLPVACAVSSAGASPGRRGTPRETCHRNLPGCCLFICVIIQVEKVFTETLVFPTAVHFHHCCQEQDSQPTCSVPQNQAMPCPAHRLSAQGSLNKLPSTANQKLIVIVGCYGSPGPYGQCFPCNMLSKQATWAVNGDR